jgi:integrase/recombinase XerD
LGGDALSLKLVKRSGSDHWYLRGTVRKQSVFESTGTDDKKAAEAIRVKREARLLEDSVYGKQSTVTFFEAAVSYMAGGGSPRFLGEEKNGRWTRLLGHFEKTKLHSIGQDELDAAANLLYPNTSAATRNRQCHAPFITVWNHAVRNKWAEPRKWVRPRKPKGTAVKLAAKKYRAGTKPVAYDYAAKFVMAMSPSPAMLLTTMFYTGMRPIELFVMEDYQINIEGRWITLDESKTGEPRGVPMHELLVPLFTGLCKRGGFLFRTPRGKPYEPKEDEGGQMKTAINGARRRSGIRNISPYTGRHSCSTQLVVNGIHPHIKDQIMGHAVGDDMSRHYTNVPQPKLIEAINTLPVINEWANAPWIKDPLTWANKLAAGTGKRNDLVKKASVCS